MIEPIKNDPLSSELSDINWKEHPHKHRHAFRRDYEPSTNSTMSEEQEQKC